VRLLFIGEAPPASGRFFYAANSGLYRAIRQAFIAVLPDLVSADFLESFCGLGCYLIDLCRTPVDRLARKQRQEVCVAGEIRLGHTIAQLGPEIIVTVVRSITANVERALLLANWEGTHLELPYPGRWRHHQFAFEKALAPILKREFAHGTKTSRQD
jgi:hypothetical protein